METFFNALLDNKLEGMRQETNRALAHIVAKTDSALETMDTRLSLQERTMAVATLQNRVDPINQAYDALVSQRRQLQSLIRERKKLAKSTSPDQEDLADLDAQIGLAQCANVRVPLEKLVY
jgi:exonuclease VII large subunit